MYYSWIGSVEYHILLSYLFLITIIIWSVCLTCSKLLIFCVFDVCYKGSIKLILIKSFHRYWSRLLKKLSDYGEFGK